MFMSELDRYLQAATRDNTRRSYRAAIEHFEVSWGGFLPATADSIARYLVAYAGELSINTLKLRLSALAPRRRWCARYSRAFARCIRRRRNRQSRCSCSTSNRQ
jgi:hypothetical protein